MRRISLVAVGLVGLVATACTNGLEKKPAAQVEREAVAALKSARTVHVKGTASGSDGRPVRLDLRIKGNSTDGTIGLRGEQFAIITMLCHRGEPRDHVRGLRRRSKAAAGD